MAKLINSLKIFGFAFLIMFLGTYAGSEGTSKDWRRLGISLTFFIVSLFSYLSWWNLTILVQNLFLKLGHGIPSPTDEGSSIGKLFYKLFKGNEFLTNCFTRGILAFLNCLCFIGVVIINQNWLEYTLCSIGIILTFALIQWRNLGTYTFKLKDKTVYACISDVISYGVLGVLGSMIIF